MDRVSEDQDPGVADYWERIQEDWNGCKVYRPCEYPSVLILRDQPGNTGFFEAGERPWYSVKDLLSLAQEDLTAGRIKWYRPVILEDE